MIDRHPWLAYAVLGGVLLAFGALAVLFVRGGAERADLRGLDLQPAPQAAQVVAQENTQENRTTSPSRQGPRGVDPAWAVRTGAKAGIPATAIRAYADAQLRIDREQPGCNLAWNTLAGIGWVESHHGTIDGRRLGADGRSSTPVIGPALDGGTFAAIRSTPRSRAWHGDATWEHAVGPLQFIASTWERWGSDGNGDGTADPLDLFDAAYSAARYLCADGHDLATVTGWHAAVHSYNHDDQYVLNVLNAANTYAQRTR